MNKSTQSPNLRNWICALQALLVLAVVTYGQQPRTPVPDADELAKAENAIRKLFKSEYASEKAADRVALSKRLLAQALDSSNDAASRYVLFRESSDLAAKAGFLSLAWQAVDEMARVFAVNAPAQKLPALQVVAAATTSQTGNENMVASILPVVEAAMQLDAFDTADQLLKIADNSARLAKSVAKARSVAAVAATLETMRKEHAKARQAIEVLASDPKDADANLTLGRFLCFHKENWTVGLPRLAKGSDAALRDLADKTLKASDEEGVAADIAGAWWDAADKLTGRERDAVRRYSAERYRAAWSKLTGLQRELAEKRILEGGKRQDRRVYNLIPLIDTTRDVLHGTWRIDNNQLRCETAHFVPRVQIPYRPPEEYDFLVTFTQPNLRNGINLIMPNKHGGTFFWCVSSDNGTGYCLSINGANAQSKLPKARVILPNTVHTTIVQVRRDGVKAYLDNTLIREYKTDFKDLLVDGWRETKDRSVLAVACDDPTVFQEIQIIEFDGAGKRAR